MRDSNGREPAQNWPNQANKFEEPDNAPHHQIEEFELRLQFSEILQHFLDQVKRDFSLTNDRWIWIWIWIPALPDYFPDDELCEAGESHDKGKDEENNVKTPH